MFKINLINSIRTLIVLSYIFVMELLTILNKYCKPGIKQLNVRGEVDDRDLIRVGIVGSRHMTFYGRQVVKDICQILAGQNITVVSGLMYGVDIEAHKQILAFGGRTIGVLGYGFNQLNTNQYAKDIIDIIIKEDRGAVISEFDDTQPPQVWTFPKRNRIVAALSDYIIIVEAGKDSGTLITADLALEMGKDVYVVCGSIYSDQSYGCNKLLIEGAIPLYDLNQLKIGKEGSFQKPLANLVDFEENPQMKAVYDHLIVHKDRLPVDKYELMKNTLGSVNELNIVLSELELNNLIRVEGDNIELN